MTAIQMDNALVITDKETAEEADESGRWIAAKNDSHVDLTEVA